VEINKISKPFSEARLEHKVRRELNKISEIKEVSEGLEDSSEAAEIDELPSKIEGQLQESREESK